MRGLHCVSPAQHMPEVTAPSGLALLVDGSCLQALACISGELWNADTGELICRNTAEYGTGAPGPANEKAYVVGIPPVKDASSTLTCFSGSALPFTH